jgi:uncharacterized protein
VTLTALGYLAATGAAGAAGAINALAGGGTLISFPVLVGIGVPAVDANVTNTVALVPGYLSGAWAQRDDLRPQLRQSRGLAVAAFVGALAGSVLLVTISQEAFRAAVPYLILLSCGLLLGQDWLRDRLRPAAVAPAPAPASDGRPPVFAARPLDRPLLLALVFVGAAYGGFFGAGLGIMLLAVLGLFTTGSLIQVNALKQALSFVINLVAAVFFVFSGHVRWELVPEMAAAAMLGAVLGVRLVRVIDPARLRLVVVVVGVAAAIAFWVG